MILTHTSPDIITTINSDGLFGSCLCFANREYVMTAADTYYVYELEIGEEVILNAKSIGDVEEEGHEAILNVYICRIMEMVGVGEDTAYDLLSHRSSVWDLPATDGIDFAEMDWVMQRLAAEYAVEIGYRGAAMTDEQ
jgi:hypothetical protein